MRIFVLGAESFRGTQMIQRISDVESKNDFKTMIWKRMIQKLVTFSGSKSLEFYGFQVLYSQGVEAFLPQTLENQWIPWRWVNGPDSQSSDD